MKVLVTGGGGLQIDLGQRTRFAQRARGFETLLRNREARFRCQHAGARALRLAARLALREGNDNPLSPIGTDHLLIGVFLTRNSRAHELLVANHATSHRLRKALKPKGYSDEP